MSERRLSFREFLSELRRRRVFRVALVYVIVAYAVLQAAQFVFASLSVPEWAFPALVICGIVGFPIALVLGWAFDLLPARSPSRRAGGRAETTNGATKEEGATRDTASGETPDDDVTPAPGVVVLALLFALAVAAVAGWCGFLRSENNARSEATNLSLRSAACAPHLEATGKGPTGGLTSLNPRAGRSASEHSTRSVTGPGHSVQPPSSRNGGSVLRENLRTSSSLLHPSCPTGR